MFFGARGWCKLKNATLQKNKDCQHFGCRHLGTYLQSGPLLAIHRVITALNDKWLKNPTIGVRIALWITGWGPLCEVFMVQHLDHPEAWISFGRKFSPPEITMIALGGKWTDGTYQWRWMEDECLFGGLVIFRFHVNFPGWCLLSADSLTFHHKIS